jgi:hypothetical protein
MTHLLSIAADPRRLALAFWTIAILTAHHSSALALASALVAAVLSEAEVMQ